MKLLYFLRRHLVKPLGIETSNPLRIFTGLSAYHPIKLEVQDSTKNRLHILKLDLGFFPFLLLLNIADDLGTEIHIFITFFIYKAKLKHNQVSLGLANCTLILSLLKTVHNLFKVILKSLEVHISRILRRFWLLHS